MRRNRWFWLAVMFLLINGYGVFRVTEYLRSVSGSGGVRVISVSHGEGDYLQGSDEIHWEFSSEMAGPDEVDRWLEIGPVRFIPRVHGHFCWDRPDRLTFIPAQSWTACRSLVATLDEDLTSREGRALAGRRVFEMGTEPLRLLAVSQTDISRRRRVSLRLEFNGPVPEDLLDASLSLAGPGGEEVEYRLEGRSGGKVVVIKTDSLPSGWEYLNLELDERLRSTAGPRGLAETVRERVAISEELALLSLKPRMNRVSGGLVEASFTAPIEVEGALNFISFEPPVDLTIEERYSYGSQSRYRIRGDFEPGRTYSLRLRKGLPGLYGPGLIEDLVRNVYFPARPASLAFSHRGHYLSREGSRLVPVTTVNLNKFKVTIDRIYPNNLVQFAMREADNYSGYYGRANQGLTERVGGEEIAVASDPNQPHETMIDLKMYPGADRSGAYWITIDSEETGSEEHLVVVTDTGIAVKVSPRDILVWANSIRTLDPVSGADVRIYSKANQEIASGVTDQDGLVQISLEGRGEEGVPFLVTVQDGEDISYIALSGAEVPGLDRPGGRPYLREGYEAYLTSFRGVYRPGEEASVSAILRGADLKAPSPFPVIFRLLRPDGKEDRRVTVLLSEAGTAEAEFQLADYAMTGRYRVECLVPGSDKPIGKISFAVEEFVPPRIEVEALADEGRAGAGEELNFAVAGRHLFGSPAAGNPVQGWIEFRPEGFEPPDWPEYRFGDPEKSSPVVNKKLGDDRLDEEGMTLFSVEIPDGLYPPAALRARFGCTVMESGGRPISAYASRTVDPYPFYIGLRPEGVGGYYPAGEEIELQVAAVRPDGGVSEEVGELELRVSRITWVTVLKENSSGRYSYDSERRLHSVHRASVRIKEGRGEINFTPAQPGRYLLTVKDPDSGSATSLVLYAGSGDQEWIAWSMERPERVELSLDRKGYHPGDTASLLVKSPFSGLALVTVESDRVLDRWIVPLSRNTAEIPIPIKDGYTPNAYCSITVIRRVSPGEKWAPHRAAGSIPLLLDNSAQRLEVSIRAPETVRPRERLTVSIDVTDREGIGVPAMVALAAVDEGICNLTGFQLPDPFAFFLGRRSLSVKLFDIYSLLMPEIEPGIDGSASAPGGGGMAEEKALKGRLNPVGARRFKPVALRSGWVETDGSGQAEIGFELPEFTGELRLMALAVSGDAFGSSEEAVTVKRPLVVESSLPRFL
ncbi:MAG: MG2 domain-containing protein, partial [Candidatus Auribacterota bacterium]|nr:MG2 domain-containing protein [Candidatus Auribacterota bacterium]